MSDKIEENLSEAAKHIIFNCIDLEKDTKIFIIYDVSTKEILGYFTNNLLEYGIEVGTWEIEIADRHGFEPSIDLSDKMMEYNVIMCMTKYSLAHTNARKRANEKGIKFLSMPEYNSIMMQRSAIKVNYKDCLKDVERISDLLTKAHLIEVHSKAGTKLYLDVKDRKGNCCPGFVNEKYLLGSPPDIEANIAPNENQTEGIIVVDGSITHEKIGLLKIPLTLRILKGKITEIISDDVITKNILNDIFSKTNNKALVVGELGIGLNPAAALCGNMLVDEGTYGCIHFGFGSNWTIGGENMIDFHLDFVIKKPTLILDNNIILKEGELI